MSFIYPLCSSSKGNCTYIGDNSSGILVDAGVGPRNFMSLLKLRDLDVNAIKAIFITHEHSDHICGLKKITSMIDVPVFATRETLEMIIEKDAVSEKAKLYEINKRKKAVGGFEVGSFDTSHDSVHSVGYTVATADMKKISVCTDLGFVSESVHENLSGSDVVLLESNYEEYMLLNGNYPEYLKMRIHSDMGHLSNENCAKEIKSLINEGTNKFILGHLSEENNTPEVALTRTVDYLSEYGMVIGNDYKAMVAPKKSIGKIVEV